MKILIIILLTASMAFAEELTGEQKKYTDIGVYCATVSCDDVIDKLIAATKGEKTDIKTDADSRLKKIDKCIKDEIHKYRLDKE